jgi:hypothetical protein
MQVIFLVVAFFKSLIYSDRKLFTGFIKAAFMAWKLTVKSVIDKAPIDVTRNTHHEISVR